MQTHFSAEQLADPRIAHAEGILRSCVHCGFCTATCPTYVLLGDELDSPRGRIYLIKDMLENDRPATEEVVKHVDRCLSCLSCMTTCPSGVNYMHLVDHARAHIEETYKRPVTDRAMRALLAWLLPRTWAFRLALFGGRLGRPFARFMPKQLRVLLDLVPDESVPLFDRPHELAPITGAEKHRRVALLTGCVQDVLGRPVHDATIRLLGRHGVEVIPTPEAGCCGALTHHLGKEDAGKASARKAIDAWMAELDGKGLDAIVVNASGCGTTIKDYGHMLGDDPAYAEKAQRIAALAKDVTEYLDELGLKEPAGLPSLTVAYHSACSMQHGQKIKEEPVRLLQAAGFTVRQPPEGHLCCGSAGTYNILQPEISARLKERKVANIETVQPDVVATGNIGCMVQIGSGTEIPVVHTVELLDWATGGPKPAGLPA